MTTTETLICMWPTTTDVTIFIATTGVISRMSRRILASKTCHPGGGYAGDLDTPEGPVAGHRTCHDPDGPRDVWSYPPEPDYRLLTNRDDISRDLSVALTGRNHALDRPRASLKRERPLLTLAQQPFAKAGLERSASRFRK